MSTRFLNNSQLWHEIQHRTARARRCRVAVAYLGTGGAALLPLKQGDVLVVDLSIAAVRQGITNPSEVRTLQRAGVSVFTRGSLHAKFVIADRTLIASSANISHNSRDNLDEAGILTDDPTALRSAGQFFDALCSEPVGPEYLKKCLAEYRPPTFKPATERPIKTATRSVRVAEAKLWFLGNLRLIDLSNADREGIATVERKAEARLIDAQHTEVTWLRYGGSPTFLRNIRMGDWVLECMRYDDGRWVGPAAQVLGLDVWISPRGKRYQMLMLETARNGKSMRLADFRKRVRRIEPELDRENPRTRPIRDRQHADIILKLWTPRGRVSKRSALAARRVAQPCADARRQAHEARAVRRFLLDSVPDL